MIDPAVIPIPPTARSAQRTVERTGFSLVEVLVAFTLLATVLSASYRGLAAGARTEAIATTRIVAVQRAESLIAEARAGAEPFERRDGAWTERLRVLDTGQPGLQKIEAEIVHNDRALSLTSLRPAR